MHTIVIYSILSVLAVSVISLVGLVSIPLHSRFGKKLLHFMVSFSVGALLGDVFIHLLPELAGNNQLTLSVSITILISILGFFIFERYIHWHHHHSEDEQAESQHAHYHPVVFLNLFGDGIHNFIDGMIIGGAYLISIEVGIATTIAVLLHEIPQEFGDFGVLVYGGLSRTKALFFNFLSALAALLGVIAILAIGNSQSYAPYIIAIGIASFIYISLADLIPEIQKSREKTTPQLFAIVLGVGVMLLLLILN